MQAVPPNNSEQHQKKKGWQAYKLDHYAQELVILYRDKDVLGESHKMRMAVAYGLERFWGEHLRYEKKTEDRDKGLYWKAAWQTVAKILKEADINLPDGDGKIRHDDEAGKIKSVAEEIWSMDVEDQRVALMVLTQFCDSLVWWTQRYKIKDTENG